MGVPAGLIMQLNDPYIEVFVSSKSEGNPYHPGDMEKVWNSGLYCETVIKTKDKLLVPNALKDDNWKNNPDIKLNMVSYLGHPIFLPDGTPFGTIYTTQYWNKASERLYGYKQQEAIGCNRLDLIIPSEMKDDLSKAIREIAESGQPISSGELLLMHKDGSRVPVISHHAIVRSPGHEQEFFCLDIDIADRKQAEEDLLRERERLASIIEGTNVGTWKWNVQTGEAIFDERWAEIIGYFLEEISPVTIDTWMKFTHPDDLKNSGELLQRHFSGELDYYECEARMRHKNGEWVWVLDRGKVAVWTEDGKPLLI